MGVYIPGMEMPDRCFSCPMCDTDCCGISKGSYVEYKDIPVDVAIDRRPDWCPLVPVPHHGALIDRDALTDAIESTDWYHQAPNNEMVHGANSAEHQAWYKEQDIYSAIDNAPTIIPAHKEVDNG